MGAHVIHFEVTGKDGKKLQKFYSDVFGWEVDTDNPGGYGMVRDGENGLTGGIGDAQGGGLGGVTWYVHTDDPKGTLAKVEKLGGRVIMPLTEVAPETTIALFADPEGHVIGIM
jgi:predicted enzyme related to lactoylglutathione lyase